MTILDLKKMLKKPDHLTMDEWNEMKVLISPTGEWDGMFCSPCMAESGLAELGVDEDTDETEASFVLVPCGFFEEHEGVDSNLN